MRVMAISMYSSGASFVNNPKSTTKAYTKEQLIEMINYLIDNCYVTCGYSLFRQKVGIPMGTDCALFLANLFLLSYENEWMMRMKKARADAKKKSQQMGLSSADAESRALGLAAPSKVLKQKKQKTQKKQKKH